MTFVGDHHHHNDDDSIEDYDDENDDIGDKVNDVLDTNDDSVGADGAGRTRSPEEEHIRAVARTLWRRRVGVLIRTAARAS